MHILKITSLSKNFYLTDNRKKFTFGSDFSDEYKKRIFLNCNEKNLLGEGLTAKTYDVGDGMHVAKVYKSLRKVPVIQKDLQEEKAIIDSLAELNEGNLKFSKQKGSFIAPSGHLVAIYEKANGHALSSSELINNPKAASIYREALRKMRQHGVFHVDIKPDNFIMEEGQTPGIVSIDNMGMVKHDTPYKKWKVTPPNNPEVNHKELYNIFNPDDPKFIELNKNNHSDNQRKIKGYVSSTIRENIDELLHRTGQSGLPQVIRRAITDSDKRLASLVDKSRASSIDLSPSANFVAANLSGISAFLA